MDRARTTERKLKPHYIWSWRLSQWELLADHDDYVRFVKLGFPVLVKP